MKLLDLFPKPTHLLTVVLPQLSMNRRLGIRNPDNHPVDFEISKMPYPDDGSSNNHLGYSSLTKLIYGPCETVSS